MKAELQHPQVSFHQGDCSDPERLFDPVLLSSEPHPWLVVEDAHHNVAAVMERMHEFLLPGDYLVIEDSEVKRSDIRTFLGAHPGNYLVDTRFTDFSAAMPHAPEIRFSSGPRPATSGSAGRRISALQHLSNSRRGYQPVVAARKLTRLSCASRAVTDIDADKLFCSVKMASPTCV